MAALPVHMVKEMFFTADPIDARRACELGAVNRPAKDPEELIELSRELAHTISPRAPLAVRAIKAELHALTDANPMTSDIFEELTQLRRSAWRSNDYAEGIQAFAERRAPNFEGN